MQKVYLFNEDVSRYILDIPTIRQECSKPGQLTSNDIPNITGDNTLRRWDTMNPASIVYNFSNLDVYNISIYQESDLVFDGTIKQISLDNDNRKASIELRSEIDKILAKGCLYASPDAGETPSTAARRIASLYGLQIDSASFGQSEAVYQLDAVLIRALFIKGDFTVLGALEHLSKLGTARVFIKNSRIGFEAYSTRNSNPVTTFTDRVASPEGLSLFSPPKTVTIDKERVNGWTVTYIGNDDGVTFGEEKDRAQSVNGGVGAPVQILTQQSAEVIGRRIMRYHNRAQTEIEFTTHIRYGRDLQLRDPIAITYSQGGWQTQTLDITSIDNSNLLTSVIKGETR